MKSRAQANVPMDHDALHSFGYYSPPFERLDQDMDFKVLGMETFDLNQPNLEIMLAKVVITQRSTSSKDIMANMFWEFRQKNELDATQMSFPHYELPDSLINSLKAKLASEGQYSMGDYLKFPLSLGPLTSVKGFMLFATFDPHMFNKLTNGNGFNADPKLADTRIYLQWTDLTNNQDFRMMVMPPRSL